MVGDYQATFLQVGTYKKEGVYLCPFLMLGNAFAFPGFVALTLLARSHTILLNNFKRTMLSGGDLFIF